MAQMHETSGACRSAAGENSLHCGANMGLKDVSEQPLTIQTRFVSFDDYWLPFLEKQGPAGTCVGALPEPEREELRVRLRKRLLRDRPDGSIVLVARAWAVRGIVPRHGGPSKR